MTKTHLSHYTAPQILDQPRKLFVFRHGERVDRTFNTKTFHWVEQAFDEHGNYQPFDLNLPKILPKRAGGNEEFLYDTPLTELGYHHAVLTGKSLAQNGIDIHGVYASPALRSVQTANGIVEGLKKPHLKVNIEIGIFEWTKFYDFFGPWMSPNELVEHDYHVNPSYKPFYSTNMLKKDETIEDWYVRSHDITQEILESTQGNILIVAHRGSPYSCTTQLCGLPIPNEEDSDERVMKIQYLDGIHAEEHDDGKFKYAKMPMPRFSCSSFMD